MGVLKKFKSCEKIDTFETRTQQFVLENFLNEAKNFSRGQNDTATEECVQNIEMFEIES